MACNVDAPFPPESLPEQQMYELEQMMFQLGLHNEGNVDLLGLQKDENVDQLEEMMLQLGLQGDRNLDQVPLAAPHAPSAMPLPASASGDQGSLRTAQAWDPYRDVQQQPGQQHGSQGTQHRPSQDFVLGVNPAGRMNSDFPSLAPSSARDSIHSHLSVADTFIKQYKREFMNGMSSLLNVHLVVPSEQRAYYHNLLESLCRQCTLPDRVLSIIYVVLLANLSNIDEHIRQKKLVKRLVMIIMTVKTQHCLTGFWNEQFIVNLESLMVVATEYAHLLELFKRKFSALYTLYQRLRATKTQQQKQQE